MAGKGSEELRLDEREMIEKLCLQGRKYGYIAVLISRSHSCIKQEILKNGGKKNYKACVAQQAADDRKKAKNMKLRKHFTEDQVSLIKDCINKGYSQNRIRGIIGVSHWKIAQFFQENNLKYIPQNYMSLQDRVSALESQTELLFETIKELKK